MLVTDLIPGEVRKDLKMKEVQLEPEGWSFVSLWFVCLFSFGQKQ